MSSVITIKKTLDSRDYLLNKSYFEQQLKDIFNSAIQYCVSNLDQLAIEIKWNQDHPKHTILLEWDLICPCDDTEVKSKLWSLWLDRVYAFTAALETLGYNIWYDAFQLHADISIE